MPDVALASLPGLSPSPVAGWLALAQQPLTVLVGVTGVGKSTALAALQGLKLLPDRRDITDAVIILPLAAGPVSDREERFALTARYRQQHPGGMAQALGSLCADPQRWSGPLVFDGLRGQEEVQFAAQQFPAWRFVSLHAPDVVRVRRLLGRGDSFDAVRLEVGETGNLRRALDELQHAARVFTPAELDELAALEQVGVSSTDILAKTRIVLSERQHYDPVAARAILNTLPAARHLELGTHLLSPAEVAVQISAWLVR